MPSMRIQSTLLLLAYALCCSVSSGAQQRQNQVEAQQPAPAQVSPARIPPGPVFTLYNNGELRIEAHNTNLQDVLRAVSNQTGTVIDMPPAPDEWVIGVFGPARIRDVLASLLSGSHFNYVMQGSAADPNILVRVTLSLRVENTAGDKSQGRFSTSATNVVAVKENSEQLEEKTPPIQRELKPEDAIDPAGEGQERKVNELEALAEGIAEQGTPLSLEQAQTLAAAIATLKTQGSTAKAIGAGTLPPVERGLPGNHVSGYSGGGSASTPKPLGGKQ